MDDNTQTLAAKPGHHLAVPLFFLSSLPYFGILAYDYFFDLKFDSTFGWFGAFYLLLGLFYYAVRLIKKH